MKYQIKELSATAFMPQRSIDGVNWHDGVPIAAPSKSLAVLYVASMQKFDAQDTPGVVVWSSERSIEDNTPAVTADSAGFRPMKFVPFEEFEKGIEINDISS